MSAAAKRPTKRARTEVEEAANELVAEVRAAGAEVECPPTIEEADFERLADLKRRWGADPNFRILPLPAAAYEALGVPKPGIASMPDVAANCFMKTHRERYTSNEIEVRDLRLTHKPEDFPKFYEGPAHPHMLPDGGARVINHDAPAAADDTDMGTVVVAAGGAGAGAGAGAGHGDGIHYTHHTRF